MFREIVEKEGFLGSCALVYYFLLLLLGFVQKEYIVFPTEMFLSLFCYYYFIVYIILLLLGVI